MHHTFAMLQGSEQGLAQHLFLCGVYGQTGHWQFNGVFFKAIKARETGGR